jgi:hypothetical protein
MMNLHLSLHVDLEKTEPVLVVDNEFPRKSSEPISLGLGKNDLVMKVGWSIVDGGHSCGNSSLCGCDSVDGGHSSSNSSLLFCGCLGRETSPMRRIFFLINVNVRIIYCNSINSTGS